MLDARLKKDFDLKDIMFAAGFYEGEGCCSNSRGQILVNMSQKDPEILNRLQKIFGGRIHYSERSNTTFGKNNNPIYALVIYGKQALEFLSSVYPHLSKRRQDQIVAATIRAASYEGK